MPSDSVDPDPGGAPVPGDRRVRFYAIAASDAIGRRRVIKKIRPFGRGKYQAVGSIAALHHPRLGGAGGLVRRPGKDLGRRRARRRGLNLQAPSPKLS